MSKSQFPKDLLPKLRHPPQRNVTSLNVEDDVKSQVDYLHAWWEMTTGERLSQPDAVRILLAAALDNPRLSAPPAFRELVEDALARDALAAFG
jgi:hypothetical protein